MKRFDKKVALVTGGSSGIGLSCALRLANEGASVVIADLNEADGQKAVDQVKKNGGNAAFIKCNVADSNDCKKAVQFAKLTFGNLHLAINNAGIGGEAALTGDYTIEGWHKVLDINLNGVFYCMKYEIPEMLVAGGGNIVNISSILGHVGFPNSVAYVTSKHALLGMTKNTALEYATKNIRVNAICPGFIETPLLTTAGITPGSDMANFIAGLHPMKRMGKSEEVAAAILWLLSDEASFVTGTDLLVDGGYVAQ